MLFANKMRRAYLAWIAQLDTPEKWAEQIRQGDAEMQAELLRGVDNASLGVSPREFLSIITTMERHIQKRDPAATAYWSLRNDLEQIDRQGRSER